MSEIFISYAAEDRDQARRLAEGLERHGWSVWWDRAIPAGKDFHDVIAEAVDAARCIVVLWSRKSVSSRWVRAEAEEGANRRILVPVLLELVQVPLAFRPIQAADLTSWDGTASDQSFESLVWGISALVGAPPSASFRSPTVNGAGTSDQGQTTTIVVVADDGTPQRAADAVVIEQDCDLILETDGMLKDEKAPVERLIDALRKGEAGTPGTVIVRGAGPYRFLAIVHDLSTEPSLREEWVAGAFDAVFMEAMKRKLTSVATPPLGTVHGRLEEQRSLELLRDSLMRLRPAQLERIVLLVPAGLDRRLLDIFGQAGYPVQEE